ncbi:MAG: hypothetical protein AAF682_28790 [Planctomycetota bacterium]
MSQSKNPARPGDDAVCAEVRKRIATLMHDSRASKQARELRAHVARCPSCAEAYRGAMAQAARVGHDVRTERTERERVRRHTELKRLSRGAGRSTPRSRLWLQTFLVSAGLFFLLTRLPLIGGGGALALVRAEGTAQASGERVTNAGLPIELGRGDACNTGAASLAELESGATRLVLGASTAVLIEEASGEPGPRVRLLAGDLDVSGEGVVTTQYGVVRIGDGRTSLELDAEGLRVSCAEGQAEVTGPLGVHSLSAGDSADVGVGG